MQIFIIDYSTGHFPHQFNYIIKSFDSKEKADLFVKEAAEFLTKHIWSHDSKYSGQAAFQNETFDIIDGEFEFTIHPMELE